MTEETNKKTRRHGKVHELPPEVRKEVDLLLTEPGTTYEDVAAFLKGKGFDISKSSIGRYGKDFLSTYQRLRVVEDQSRALISEVGDGIVLDEAAGKLMAQKIIELLMRDGGVDSRSLPKHAIGLAAIIKANLSREKLKQDLKQKVGKTLDKVENQMKSMTKEEMIRSMREAYGLI